MEKQSQEANENSVDDTSQKEGHGKLDLEPEKIRAMGKLEPIMYFRLGALADEIDMTFVIFHETLSYGVEEIAEVTSHNFW